MEWLNYHHLYYFWVIAQEGSLSRSAARLRLTHSTLSEQLKLLEGFFGRALFDRRGKRLALTAFGAEIAHYANEIFQLGDELVEVARRRAEPRKAALRVGVLAELPKTIVYRLTEAALDSAGRANVEIRQADLVTLVALLQRNRVHVILTDRLPPEVAAQRVHTHKLGETDIVLCAGPTLAARYASGFPRSLNGAPVVMPARGSGLRVSLDRWFADNEIRADVTAEIDDAGLLRVFGGFERGIFPVRGVLLDEVEEVHRVQVLGSLEGIRECYYAICNERRVSHPHVVGLIEAGRQRLQPGGLKSGSAHGDWSAPPMPTAQALTDQKGDNHAMD